MAREIARGEFESGRLEGPLWVDNGNVSVSGAHVHTGTYSARFHYIGNPDLSADATAELRFDLGAVYPEVWVRYQLFIPENYRHRDGVGPDNNKFIRMWGKVYDDFEKVGASTWLNNPPDAYSSLIADWNWHRDGIGPKGVTYPNFFGPKDLGKWMDVVIHAKAATPTQPGTLQLWKNGLPVLNESGTVDNFTAGEAHGYRYGYLLGWSNSGFTEDTDLFIDDVVFGTEEKDVR